MHCLATPADVQTSVRVAPINTFYYDYTYRRERLNISVQQKRNI